MVVDKPAGLTSHDVVRRVRRLAGTRRVGHAGTLDPMATGVLLVGVGRATRLLGHLSLTDKAYDATIRLGQTTSTDDADGEVLATTPAGGVPVTAIEQAVARLTGELLQVPASVSAIKVGGRRAHARVRAGEDVTLPARAVRVERFDVLAVRRGVEPDSHTDGGDVDVVDVDVSVTCSSGTYVRALARDLGAALGVGGHLVRLRRTRVGPFTVDAATPLDSVPSPPKLLSLADAAAGFLQRHVSAEDARRLASGIPLVAQGQAGETGPVAVFDPQRRLVALVRERDGLARSLVVFHPALP